MRHQCHALHQVSGKENTLKYLHAAAFSPVLETWAKAVDKGFFASWPGLTAKDIRKLPKSIATCMGHMTQTKHGVRSTKARAQPAADQSAERQPEPDPTQEPNNEATEWVMALVKDKTRYTPTKQAGFP